jgi:hypothetical protein
MVKELNVRISIRLRSVARTMTGQRLETMSTTRRIMNGEATQIEKRTRRKRGGRPALSSILTEPTAPAKSAAKDTARRGRRKPASLIAGAPDDITDQIIPRISYNSST